MWREMSELSVVGGRGRKKKEILPLGDKILGETRRRDRKLTRLGASHRRERRA